MSRKFIFSVVAGAVAVTGLFAQPSRASSEDVAKILFGVATLYILSEALSDDGPVAAAPAPHSHAHPHPHKPKYPRHLPPRNGSYAPIPGHCVKHVHSHNGTVRLVSHDCVHRHYPHAHHLPKGCRTNVNSHHGVYHGYKQRCLRNNGFHVDRW